MPNKEARYSDMLTCLCPPLSWAPWEVGLGTAAERFRKTDVICLFLEMCQGGTSRNTGQSCWLGQQRLWGPQKNLSIAAFAEEIITSVPTSGQEQKLEQPPFHFVLRVTNCCLVTHFKILKIFRQTDNFYCHIKDNSTLKFKNTLRKRGNHKASKEQVSQLMAPLIWITDWGKQATLEVIEKFWPECSS